MPESTPSCKPFRHAACALLLGLCGLAPVAAAPRSAALQRMDDALGDNPIAVLRNAESSLEGGASRLPPAERLDAALRLAAAGDLLENPDAARRGVDLGLPLARQLKDEGAVCIFNQAQAGIALADDVRIETVIARLGEAISAANVSGMPWCAARLRLAQSQIYSNVSRGAEAMAALVDAHRQFELQHDTVNIANVLAGLSWLYRRERDNEQSLQRAIDSGKAALAMLDPARQRYLAAVANHTLAGAYFAAKLLPQAREHVDRAFRLTTSIGDLNGTAYVAQLHGNIELAAGRPAEALAEFDRASELFKRHDLAAMMFEAAIGRVGALTALHRHAEAQAALDAADGLRRRQDATSADLSYQRTALEFYETFGDLPQALRASKALDATRQKYASEDNRKAADALQERFETQRKDAENQLLREQQRAAESQRWLLLVTLVLSFALLVAMGCYLFQQMNQRRRMAELAARDDLTGMPNRRSILETAREVNIERRRSHEPACIAVLDIDHFKRINDTYGHEVGDAALVTFARVCGERLRERDRLGRFGGEEFLLVLPGADVADLPAVFDRLRTGLRAAAVPGMPSDVRLAFSMGCAVFEGEDEIEQAIHRADQALYRAKEAGRDRLAVAAMV